MTTTTNEEFTAFTQEDIVYDDECSECEQDTDAPLAFVNREEPDNVIHEACLYQLKPREREMFIRIKDVPSGKPTVTEKVDAMIGESLNQESTKEERRREILDNLSTAIEHFEEFLQEFGEVDAGTNEVFSHASKEYNYTISRTDYDINEPVELIIGKE